MTVPRGSTVLNVLEHSNVLYPVFNGFKVLYIANSSYYLVSLNNDADTTLCHWVFKTEPPTIQSANNLGRIFVQTTAGWGAITENPLNDVYVTNIGMTVTFIYKRIPPECKKTHKDEWLSKLKGTIKSVSIMRGL